MPQNEIQSIDLACPWTDLRSGVFALTYVDGTTSSINWNDDEATILLAFDNIVAFVGNLSVTKELDSITVEWINSLANTDIDLPAVSANSLKQTCPVSYTQIQAGIADIPITPNNSTSITAVAPVSEIQQVSLGGATTGTFDLVGNPGSATVNTLDTAGIQAACDTIWGSGNTSVSNIGLGEFSVTFQGAYGSQEVDDMSVANNTTDGSPGVSVPTQGVSGVHQVDNCSFDGTANSGAMTFDGNSLAYNVDASGLSISGASATGTPASGMITTTWNDYYSHSPVTVSANTLKIAGQKQIDDVHINNATEGSFKITVDGQDTGNIDYNSNNAAIESALNPAGPPNYVATVTGSGTPVSPWRITSTANGPRTLTASEGVAALLKAASVTPSTTQEGEGSGGSEVAILGSGSGFSPDMGAGSGFK